MNRAWVETDYYEVLGVPSTADKDEIRRAYRRLAQELHPDANPDDPKAEDRFKSVSEAYQVLSSEEQRKEYDEVRRLVGSGAFSDGFGGFGQGGFGGQRVRMEDLGDLFGGSGGFGDLFRGATRQQGPRRGKDIGTSITIDFEDAIRGAEKTIRIAGEASCSRCRGSGAEPGTSRAICPTCGGSGQQAQNQGFFSFAQPCSHCGGSGHVIPTPCTQCRGLGSERRQRTITVKIPAGVTDGGSIRAKGKGAPGRNGGPPGDLHITVRVTPHPRFGRRDDHLTLHVPITFVEAALGTEVDVPTLDEPVRLKIPPGTQPGQTFRVRGQGVQHARGKNGDLLVTVDVTVPAKLSRKAKKALEEFASVTNETDPRTDMEDAS